MYMGSKPKSFHRPLNCLVEKSAKLSVTKARSTASLTKLLLKTLSVNADDGEFAQHDFGHREKNMNNRQPVVFTP